MNSTFLQTLPPLLSMGDIFAAIDRRAGVGDALSGNFVGRALEAIDQRRRSLAPEARPAPAGVTTAREERR